MERKEYYKAFYEMERFNADFKLTHYGGTTTPP